jgi:hypothetical protein
VAERLISRELSASLNLPEKDKELLDMMKSIDWRNPNSEEQRYIFAKEIVRQAQDLVELVDPTSLMLDQKTYDPSVTNIKFKDVVGFEARAVTAGGFKEAIRIDNEIVSLPIPRRYDHVTIEMLKEDLELGTYDDIAGIREGIAEALLRKKINAVWTACNDAITMTDITGGSGNDNLIRLKGGALTESALDWAIDKMDSDGGGVYSIIGHPTKVNPIVKFSTFQTIMPEKVKLDYWRTGYVGIYRGASIVKLPAVVDKKYGIAPTDENSVFVLGAGLGEIAQIRGLRADTWDDPARDIQFISAQHKYVVLTWQPKGAFRLRLY